MSFSIFSSNPRLFVLGFTVFLAVIGGGLGSLKFLFAGTGDLADESEIVRVQLSARDLCLYRTVAEDNHAFYKMKLYEARKPEIVVLGSSRVLQFHHAMFKQSFLNMGRTMRSLNGDRQIVTLLLQRYTPKLVLVGIDFWWFNRGHYVPTDRPLEFKRVDAASPDVLTRLVRAIVERPEYLFDLSYVFRPLECHLGIEAKTFQRGFGQDGFFYYGRRLQTSPESTSDYRFRNTKERIRSGTGRFEHGVEPEPVFIERLLDLVKELEERGVETVLYFPPVAPSVLAAMREQGGYAYIDRLKEELRARAVVFHDFHDPAVLSLTDCEFMDGFHGGDVAHAVMLQALVGARPGLARFVDAAELARVSRHRGLAAYYTTADLGVEEPDFLGLECRKENPGDDPPVTTAGLSSQVRRDP